MRILIVDDHVLIREALRSVLAEIAPRADLLEAADAARADKWLADHDIDLVVLDLRLPDRSGLELLTEVRASYPSTSVVVLSESDRRDDITKALEAGAVGFIPKSASREIMLGALKLIFAGGTYIPPQAIANSPREQAGNTSRKVATTRPSLSPRQREVLELLMEGKSNKSICRELGLAEPTVKNHLTAIFRILKASNRTEAVIAANALELVSRRPKGDS